MAIKSKRDKTADYQEDYLLNTSEYQPQLPGLRIHSFCHSRLNPHWTPLKSRYPFIIVYMILSGEDLYIAEDGGTVHLQPNFFVVADLNEATSKSFHLRKDTLERYFILLEVNHFLRTLLRELFPGGLPKFLSQEAIRLKRCFEDIRRVLRKKGEIDDVLLGAMGYRLLCEATRQTTPRSRLPENLTVALRYIDNHFCDPALTRRDIASASGMCVVLLGRLFQEHLNTTVNHYVMDFRLEKAKHLLEQTKQPIKEIAAQCGFSYAYYFAKVFHEKNGILPSEYRSQKRQID